jgi:hypothetical protein
MYQQGIVVPARGTSARPTNPVEVAIMSNVPGATTRRSGTERRIIRLIFVT